MKEAGSCLLAILAFITFCAYIVGLLCLGLSLIWLIFDVTQNVILAYWGLGLCIGGRIVYKPLVKILTEGD